MAKRKYKLKPIEPGTAFDGLFGDCEELKTLLLTHKKKWGDAEEILQSGTIPLEDCDVFNEQLQYFFYGRPSYVIGQGVGNRKDRLYFPVCFLIDPAYINIDSVFPFDSGAFAETFYDDYIAKDMDINKFLITPTLQSIKGFINYFYGDNEQYYSRKPKHIATTCYTTNELYAYINILTASGATPFDVRAETIEIITKEPLDLRKSVKGIVIPNEFALVPKVKGIIEKMKASGVDIIVYHVMGLGPEQYNAIMYSKIYEYFQSKGLFRKS